MSHNRFALLMENSQSEEWRQINRRPKEAQLIISRRPVKKFITPKPVSQQSELRKRHLYTYRIVNNGNVENNSTLYVPTGVAHPHQVYELFEDAIERAKHMPDVFGPNFKCDVKVNLVRNYRDEYVGYAYVDVDNPKFYYAMIGYNVDGTERAEYIDDPNWVPPSSTPYAVGAAETAGTAISSAVVDVAETAATLNAVGEAGIDIFNEKFGNMKWADYEDDVVPAPPKIRKELPALLLLKSYKYDTQQQEHLRTSEQYGTLTVSPAFIVPGVKPEYDDCSLYVSEVPAEDYNFLYTLFARYSRYGSSSDRFYPKITVRFCNKKDDEEPDEQKSKYYAIIQYDHPYDAAFAMAMLQKIRAQYNGEDITMHVRYAFKNRRG